MFVTTGFINISRQTPSLSAPLVNQIEKTWNLQNKGVCWKINTNLSKKKWRFIQWKHWTDYSIWEQLQTHHSEEPESVSHAMLRRKLGSDEHYSFVTKVYESDYISNIGSIADCKEYKLKNTEKNILWTVHTKTTDIIFGTIFCCKYFDRSGDCYQLHPNHQQRKQRKQNNTQDIDIEPNIDPTGLNKYYLISHTKVFFTQNNF